SASSASSLLSDGAVSRGASLLGFWASCTRRAYEDRLPSFETTRHEARRAKPPSPPSPACGRTRCHGMEHEARHAHPKVRYGRTGDGGYRTVRRTLVWTPGEPSTIVAGGGCWECRADTDPPPARLPVGWTV